MLTLSKLRSWESVLSGCKFSIDLTTPRQSLRPIALAQRIAFAFTDDSCPFNEAFREAALAILEDRGFIPQPSYYAKLECKDWLGLAKELCLDFFPDLMGSLDITDEDMELESQNDIFSLLYQEWNSAFKGRSLTAFKEMLNIYENDWTENPSQYYAKTFVIFQSSGTGKSRLAREAGNFYISFPFVFRKEGETGYPPGDVAIMKHLGDFSAIHNDIRAGAFIAAVCSVGMQPANISLLQPLLT